MFTISLCMIVKNEEDVLGRILDCAKNFADEIIIVDTGSTDNTKQIAKNYTYKIFDFEWVDDFAKARNFAYSKATCDYQMWLDADDFIDEENIRKIINLKHSSANASQPDPVSVYMFKYQFGEMVYFRERLTKQSQNFQWEGFVHEAIVPRGKIEYCDITIQHKKVSSGDTKRNLNLYRKAIKRGHVFNARETYYYARELYYNGYFSKAISTFKCFLKMPNTFYADHLGAEILLYESYKIKKQHKKAQNSLFDALRFHSPTPELCCKLGYSFCELNDFDKAISWFKIALTCEKQTSGFVEKKYENIVPFLELTRLCYALGRQDEAKLYHTLAKSTDANHPSVIYNDQFFKD